MIAKSRVCSFAIMPMLVLVSALLFGQDWSAAYEPVLNDAEQIDAIERQIERELVQSSAPSADQEASIRKLGTIDPELQAVWTLSLIHI